MTQVSLITVYYNTPDYLLRLYNSALQYLARVNYEWLIVDNNSNQDLSDRLEGVRYFRLSENTGFGRGCNYAAQRAGGNYLFFVNPDCEFIEDCITPLLQKMKDYELAAPRVLNSNGSIQLSFGPYLSVANEAIQKYRTKREGMPRIQNWILKQGSFSPDYVSGCAFMIRKKIFQEIGGFDENFFLYNEDVDLCKRIKDAGYRILYLSDTGILHHRNRSTEQEREEVNREYRRSQRYYYSKHNSRLQNFLLNAYLALSGK